MSKLFIGISGKMGTGKSTISHMLKAAFQDTGKVDIVSIASPLYKAQSMLYTEYGLTVSGEKDRDLLITLGKWGRDKNPDFWVEQFAKSVIGSDSEIIICDDIRFKNEVAFFEERGFLFRLEGSQRGDNLDLSKASDPTECALDDYNFDNIIDNNKTPAEICKEIAEILLKRS